MSQSPLISDDSEHTCSCCGRINGCVKLVIIGLVLWIFTFIAGVVMFIVGLVINLPSPWMTGLCVGILSVGATSVFCG